MEKKKHQSLMVTSTWSTERSARDLQTKAAISCRAEHGRGKGGGVKKYLKCRSSNLTDPMYKGPGSDVYPGETSCFDLARWLQLFAGIARMRLQS